MIIYLGGPIIMIIYSGGPIIMTQIENEYGNYGYTDYVRDKVNINLIACF